MRLDRPAFTGLTFVWNSTSSFSTYIVSLGLSLAQVSSRLISRTFLVFPVWPSARDLVVAGTHLQLAPFLLSSLILSGLRYWFLGLSLGVHVSEITALALLTHTLSLVSWLFSNRTIPTFVRQAVPSRSQSLRNMMASYMKFRKRVPNPKMWCWKRVY